MIGIPFAEGVGVGIEEGMKDVMKKIKAGTNSLVSGAIPSTGTVSKAIAQQVPKQAAKVGTQITQNNTFTAKTLTPYEQRVQLKKLDNDLAEVFA
jgi:hypothetical protein